MICVLLQPTTRAAERVDIHFEFRNSVVSLHEPAILLFKVHNGLNREITLDLGFDKRQHFSFSIATPERRVIRSQPLYPEGFHASGNVVVSAGGNYDQALVLNQWFRFDSVGQYLLTARVDPDFEIEGVTGLRISPEQLHLEVKPRDPQRLAEICESLSDQVKMAPNAQEAQEPALVLSYVEDPICVQYLSQILAARKLVEGRAIAGLERIGNDYAVTVLLSVLNSEYGDIPNLAREALRRILQSTSDPFVKDRIIRAGIGT